MRHYIITALIAIIVSIGANALYTPAEDPVGVGAPADRLPDAINRPKIEPERPTEEYSDNPQKYFEKMADEFEFYKQKISELEARINELEK